MLPPAPPPDTWEPRRPFVFIAGDLALDLVNTVDWTAPRLSADRLTSYDRLLEWAVGAALVRPGDAATIRRAVASRAVDGERAVAWARRVRHVLAGVVRDMIAAPAPAGAPPTGAALVAFQTLVADAHRGGTLVAGRRPAASRARRAAAAAPLVIRWPWQDLAGHADGASLPLDSLLWPVIRAAETLLTSPEAVAIRMCAGDGCGWLFVDRSRGRRRRWCAMRTCGTIAKERRRTRAPAVPLSRIVEGHARRG